MNKTILASISTFIAVFSLNAQVNILSNAINFRSNVSSDLSQLTNHYGSMRLTGSNGTSAFSATYPTNNSTIDAIGVSGTSAPSLFYGIGGKFTGGQTGVYGLAGQNGSTSNRGTASIYGGYFLAYNTTGSYTNCIGVFATAQGTGTQTKWAGFFAGNVYSTGIYSTSDSIVKTNTEELSGSLAKVMKLHPKRYDFDREKFPKMGLKSGKQLGLFAQEVEDILPEVVTTVNLPEECQSNGVTSVKSINYAALIPVLIGAIQEQQKIILKLQKDLDNVKVQVGLK